MPGAGTTRGRLAVLACMAAAVAGCERTSSGSHDIGSPRLGVSTVIVLPDTQGYTRSYPEFMLAQGRWIAATARDLDVRFVLHLGDLTDKRKPGEWRVVAQAFAALGDVSFAVVPGNHDYERDARRKTRLAEFFPPASLAQAPTYGGLFSPDSMDNSFHLVELAGAAWLVLGLEFGPRDAVLAWASRVLEQHADRNAIVFTHAYLYRDGQRYDWSRHGDRQEFNPHSYSLRRMPERLPEVNDGQEMWDKLVSRHSNIKLVLCGHVPHIGAARMTSKRADGTLVHEMMVNFQSGPSGGEGYLRILQFDDRGVWAWTYSPKLDRYLATSGHQFFLPRNW